MQLPARPRRLRRHAAIRALTQETRLHPSDLVQPVFVRDGSGTDEAITALPGQTRYSLASLPHAVEKILASGIEAIALFPAIPAEAKSADGRAASDPQGLAPRAIQAIKQRFPEVCVFADVALDPYTIHGHDGVLTADGRDVDNDATVAILGEQAKVLAAAGTDFVAPSDMMDGRIGAIRTALDAAGFTGTGILAYAAKFASSYYGPFRSAVGSAQAAGTTQLDKRTYQLNPANAREAGREIALDLAEGADLVMVKPAGLYLDIIAQARAHSDRPVVAYQVSGEYAQIHAAAAMGWLDLAAARDESLLAIKRAGADLIFTYFACEVAQHLRDESTPTTTPLRANDGPLESYEDSAGI